MEKNLPFIITLSIVNVPLYILLGKLYFSGWEEFWGCVVFWIKYDRWHSLSDSYWNHIKAQFKLGVFFIVCGIIVYSEYIFILKIFPKLVYSFNGLF